MEPPRSKENTVEDWLLFLQCLHGDLTSRNILLNGDYTGAKVGDLGLAKMLQSTITDMNVGGTLAFAAPELLLNMRCNEKVPAALCFCHNCSTGALLSCICKCVADRHLLVHLAFMVKCFCLHAACDPLLDQEGMLTCHH